MDADRNAHAQDGTSHQEKFWVAFGSLLAALFLTSTKLAVGIWTNSLGILSEAAHSGLDLIAAGMTVWAVRVASQPADSRHTYGHEKVENLSALFETLLLLVTCGWIVYEALARLFSGEPPEVKANIWAFLVVLLSIGVDWSRSRVLQRTAQKHHSQALEADALHFSTDIYSSLVVLLGLVGVVLAERCQQPWLMKADAGAALAVAIVVVALSSHLGKKAIEELLDTIPAGLQAQVRQAIQQIPELAEVDQVRLRRSGAKMFADLTVRIQPTSTLEQSHQLADQAEEAIRRLLPGADVVVHVEPVPSAQGDVLGMVRSVAGRYGLAAHAIRLIEQDGQQALELHLEVPYDVTLEQAHAQATACEHQLHQLLPAVQRIVTHLEPSGGETTHGLPHGVQESQLLDTLQDFLQRRVPQAHVHDLHVVRTAEEVSASFHCTIPGQTDITQAHTLSELLEEHLRTLVPGLGRVVIHVEPAEAQQADSPSEGPGHP